MFKTLVLDSLHLYPYGRSDLAVAVRGRSLKCKSKNQGDTSGQKYLLLFDGVLVEGMQLK